MILGFNLPAGHDLFLLLETFYAAPYLCSRVVPHLADPASPSQTKGCDCLKCCFRPLGLFFFSHFASSLFNCRRCQGIEESLLDNGRKGSRRTAVFRSRCYSAPQTAPGWRPSQCLNVYLTLCKWLMDCTYKVLLQAPSLLTMASHSPFHTPVGGAAM